MAKNKKQLLLKALEESNGQLQSITFFPIPGSNDIFGVCSNTVKNPVFGKIKDRTFEVLNNPTYYKKGYYSNILEINGQSVDPIWDEHLEKIKANNGQIPS